MKSEMVQKAIKLYKSLHGSIKPYIPVMVVSSNGVHVMAKDFTIFVADQTDLQEPILIDKDIIPQLERITEGDISFTPKGCVSGSLSIVSEFEYFKDQLEEFDKVQLTEIGAQTLRKCIDRVKFAVAGTDERPILTNICWDKEYMVALDGYRIAKVSIDPFNNYGRLLIPLPVVNILSKFVSKNVEVMHFGVLEDGPDTDLYFNFDNVWIRCKMPTGEYMNYGAVMDSRECDIKFKIDRKSILKVLKQMGPEKYTEEIRDEKTGEVKKLVVKNKQQPCHVSFNGDVICLTQTNIHSTYKESLPIDIDEGTYQTLRSFKIAFNPKYFLEALKSMDDEVITVTMLSSLTPIKIYGQGIEHLVLPIRISN